MIFTGGPRFFFFHEEERKRGLLLPLLLLLLIPALASLKKKRESIASGEEARLVGNREIEQQLRWFGRPVTYAFVEVDTGSANCYD